MRGDTEAAFRRFIAKAEQLEHSRFVAFLADPGWRVDFTHPDGPQVTKPDDETRDAFILTFRFFIMQNEATSFRGLADVLDDEGVSEEWKTTFCMWRSTINEYLGSSVFEYHYGGGAHRFTNRQIMETFL